MLYMRFYRDKYKYSTIGTIKGESINKTDKIKLQIKDHFEIHFYQKRTHS